MYFSDQIKELLNRGVTVVADRYIYSGISYSVAKVAHMMG